MYGSCFVKHKTYNQDRTLASPWLAVYIPYIVLFIKFDQPLTYITYMGGACASLCSTNQIVENS